MNNSVLDLGRSSTDIMWESSCLQLSDQLLRESITPGATWFRKPS